MSTPFEIVVCECGAKIYAGASYCYSCGKLSDWKLPVFIGIDAR